MDANGKFWCRLINTIKREQSYQSNLITAHTHLDYQEVALLQRNALSTFCTLSTIICDNTSLISAPVQDLKAQKKPGLCQENTKLKMRIQKFASEVD